MAAGCATYAKSTTAAMRQAGTSGCFELDGVVSIAVSPVTASSTSVRIIAQDAKGGDYSGILATCYSSASEKHPCTVFPTAKNILIGQALTITGYYDKTTAGYEYLSIDSTTDPGSGPAPAPAPVTLAQIERGASTPAKVYQNVTFTIGASDALKLFDFSPPEFMATGGTCAGFYGFGMLPKSASGTVGAACSGTTTQLAGQTTVNAAEVLFGTDYYGGFTAQSECTCVSSKTSKPYPGLLASNSTLMGPVTAILFFDTTSAGVAYQYISPLTNADAPITNLGN